MEPSAFDRCQVRIPETVLFRDLQGEGILLDVDSGSYFGLNEVGTRMWQLLAEHGSFASAREVLLAEFEVSRERLERDLVEIVEQLAEHGLLQIEES